MTLRIAVGVIAALLVLATAVALAEAPAVAPAGAPLIVTRFRDGKLWLRTQSAPARDVLAAVGKKVRIRFVAAAEVGSDPLTLDLRGVPLERAIRRLVASIRTVAGHTTSYRREPDGSERLVEVALFVGGAPPASGPSPVVYGSEQLADPPGVTPIDVDAQIETMVAAGVPRDQAEKVMALTQEIRRLHDTPAPGAYRAEDLSPASRERLQPLLDRGVSLERAVQTLLLQERYETMLRRITPVAGLAIPTPPPPR